MRARHYLTACALIYPLMVSPAYAEPEPEEDEAETFESTEEPHEEEPPADAPPQAPAGDDEYDLEDYEDASETDLTEKPAAGRGALTGTVLDTKYREPLVEAQVEVIGHGAKALTNVEGRFRLELPPGKYSLRIGYDAHLTQRIDQVVIAEGEVKSLSVRLRPDASAVETFVVEAKADTSSLVGLSLARQRSAAMGDSVGRSEISKTPDRDAAQAAQRVVGATLVDGRFIYVRGLGDRYTNAQLNGAPLPSPEPDRQAVPLDLFPTLVLESLTVAKTFTPDKPGDFAGGSARIETRDLPEELLLSTSLGLGFNSQSTFRERLSYRGSSTDFLGFDGGTRRMPSLPDYKLSRGIRKGDGDFVLPDELAVHGRQINSYMSPLRAFTPPNHSMNVVAGNTWALGGESKLGAALALTYGRSYNLIEGRTRQSFIYRQAEQELTRVNSLKEDSGVDKVRWGAFGTLTYQHSPEHRLTLTGLRSQSSDDTAQVQEGYHQSRAAILSSTRLRFVSRALNFGQLKGEHTFPMLNRATIDWNLSLSKATRDEPDTRNTVYAEQPGGGFVYVDGSESGSHFYAEQGESSLGAGLDYTQPLSEDEESVKLKFGGLLSERARSFDSRRFSLRRLPGSPDDPFVCPEMTLSCSDRTFTQDNIGRVLELQETTFANDAYQADLDVYAGYVMADAQVTEWLRVIVGERVEVTRQSIRSFDPFAPESRAVATDLKSTDLLPAASLIFSTSEETKLRLAATRTLARPQLRELAPFRFDNYFGGYSEAGNPDLKLTKIINLDARFEWFPSLTEVVAASVFYKQFKDPIEQYIASSNDSVLVSYQNSDGARLFGVELEGRKALGFLSPSLTDFSAVLNATLSTSQIELSADANDFSTSRERPLSNQPSYTINAALDYSSDALGLRGRLLYNIVGRQIVSVGYEGLPDVYQQPRHQLDLALAKSLGTHFEVALNAKNLLNAAFIETQGKTNSGDNVVDEYRVGSEVGLTGSYKY